MTAVISYGGGVQSTAMIVRHAETRGEVRDERAMSSHWLTRYDPDDGEPYGELCNCDIGADHNGDGDLL